MIKNNSKNKLKAWEEIQLENKDNWELLWLKIGLSLELLVIKVLKPTLMYQGMMIQKIMMILTFKRFQRFQNFQIWTRVKLSHKRYSDLDLLQEQFLRKIKITPYLSLSFLIGQNEQRLLVMLSLAIFHIIPLFKELDATWMSQLDYKDLIS